MRFLHIFLRARLALCGCAFIFGASLARAQEAHTIWQEGEKPTQANVKRHPWWYDKVKPGELSGGDWVSHFSKEQEGTVEYRVEAPASGTYHFWIRANPVKSKLAYRVGSGPWVPIDTARAVDVVNVAADGKPDLRFVGWMNAGDLALERGPVTIAFKMNSENENHGAIDVFVLTTGPFTPKGKGKPGEANAAAASSEIPESGSWAFHYPADKFEPSALLDLRALNEKTAGESGFVRLTPDGNGFALGNGQPVRFWAVGSDLFRKHTPAEMERHARFLAKLGVNMVRLHCDFSPKGKNSKITDVDEQEIDGVFHLVSAMKRQGIYVTISPFWAHTKAPASWGIDGYADKEPWGVLFFNDALQAGYKAWAREVYTRKNPYTGLALGQDPAVAIIQVHNEDSLLFWTFEGIAPEQKRVLAKKFAGWLGKKYGSLQKAQTAWGGAAAKDDDLANGVAGFLLTWDLTQPQTGGKAQRAADQLEFLSRTQHDFYAEIADYFRKTLGCKQLINASNWRPADMLREGDAERWTYTANDVIAVNKYYNGGEHIGPANGWRIDPGDLFQGESALKNPTALPTALKQVAGRPMIVTESTWVAPLGYQSEGPWLMAAYQSLTGIDTFYWFSATSVDYLENPFLTFLNLGGQHPLQKWSCSIPTLMGNFPANALAYRLGYIRPGAPVVQEERSLENLWQRAAPVIVEGQSFDPNRDKIAFAEGSPVKTAVDPLAFLVGPVEVKYGGDPAKTRVADLGPFIDKTRKIVKSDTGEIALNYDIGFCTLNALKAQGVTGFLKQAGGSFPLADVTIQSGNDYAAISVVAMDNQPLKQSRKILVQVGTIARPTGWQVREAARDQKGRAVRGQEIVSTGKLPVQIANTDVTLTINNPALGKATLLDPAGYAAAPVTLNKSAAGVTLKLPPNTMYVVIE
jgi:hypothetical protein